ncbi:hypothetical protein AMATHDRAFT_140979 [Amanita thiersii Skay4041]|uniref:Protein kinase domain-containing protein n=1 Tax=Amanita thiersii Skay4041 TaxID=703135 RepID=A0A2A9NPJ1_9AGAR|nr:hypothetical protein AMATHDRAFT_140979 [Amanita thiersii Skay4041]
MLQYPVQLPPLSLSSSPKVSTKDNNINNNDYFRSNDSPRIQPVSLTAKRFQKDSLVSRSPFSHLHSALPLSVSTNLASPSPTSSPSTPSARLPRSPYISSRQASSRPVSIPNASSFASQPSSKPGSVSSSLIEDVLSPGDSVGEGSILQGEIIRLVSFGSLSDHVGSTFDDKEPAQEFEVVRRLGTGSYAVVYLVQEVLSRPPLSEDGHMCTIGQMEFDGKPARHPETVYGREYAIKCLSKVNLDEEALAAQMSEVTIHQSLKSHPNIVTLHRTLETSSFLLLLLEYVPGEDLFYFLEQARDHYDLDSHSNSADSRTPPTPSLLSNLHPSQLLSRTRLRLIASMFSQMCGAVAACHDQQVFHRDIKPENFIVTDGWTSLPDGRQERKVIVKLTDFGLSTTDIESSDMDCGSAPYMSFECRNNVAPTYRPRAADVWSLGIVLINMLYHYNPWTDTAQGACSSFDMYLRDPVNFFMTRFTGMTRAVADFLANRVFCILHDSDDDSQRITAYEFGLWVKNLPSLLGGHGVQRTVSNSSTQGHPLQVSTPLSHRPASRQPSGTASAARTPAIPTRSLSRAPSLGPAYEKEEASGLSTVIDQESESGDQTVQTQDLEVEENTSRSTSQLKRRKRGRKGKGSAIPQSSVDDTLTTLAVASQALARELSRTSKVSSHSTATKTSASSRTGHPQEPISMYALPTQLFNGRSGKPSSLSEVTPPPIPTPPTMPVTKKPSKWKLSFGKGSIASPVNAPGRISPVDEASPPNSVDLGSTSSVMSTTATNVTNLIMGLNPTSQAPSGRNEDESSNWTRGRKIRATFNSANASDKLAGQISARYPAMDYWPVPDRRSNRAISPNSTRSGRPLASSASSMASSNWRNSTSTTSSAGTSTSAFTRYSNSSARSISTTATSVSSASWRTSAKASSTNHSTYPTLPKNIKIMNGIPWELHQLPRDQHPNPVGDIFGSPPPRKQRTRKHKDNKLDTITERPNITGHKLTEYQRRDASTSTTDLGRLSSGRDEGEQIKRVQKGQINALAKMLSALRR